MSSNISEIDLDTFSELVNSIYDAAMDTALWPLFMEHLTHLLNSPSGLLRVQDLQKKEIGTCITHGLNPHFQQLYKEYYIHDDPLISEVALRETGTLIQTETDLPRNFRKTEFYNDYALPQGMVHTAGYSVEKNDSRLAVMGIHRPKKAGPYEPHELMLLKLLVPHLQRAFQINGYLSQLEDKADASCNALDQLAIGIILVDAKGKPVFINSQAESIIASDYGLSVTRQRLQATPRANSQLLHKLIHEASQPTEQTGGAVSISSPTSITSLNILVIPINQNSEPDFAADASRATAALFIGATGRPINFSLDALRRFYDLTIAEARTAVALANGDTLDEIAEKFNVSKNTIRTQLHSCYRKTGVNRQTELVKLILRDPIGMVRGGADT